jgi:hypothetical protein
METETVAGAAGVEAAEAIAFRRLYDLVEAALYHDVCEETGTREITGHIDDLGIGVRITMTRID